MSFLKNLFKGSEEDREAAYNPSSPEAKAVKAKGGGKGSAKDIEYGKNGPTEEQRKRILASQNDRSFGYYDMNTGKYIPAFVDMFDGGGMNTSGDTFQGGPFSNMLNMAGVAPYGYNRPRTYAQAGMENRPSGVSAADIEFMNTMVANNNVADYTPNFVRPEVSVSELPPADPNIMSVDELQKMINPLINNSEQGLLSPQYQQVQPQDMIAMLREQERQRRNQPPTLLG